MKNDGALCIHCSTPMKKVYIAHKGLRLEAKECGKCKTRVFTEDLTIKAIAQLEAKRLQEEYIKKPIKIGHSWGVTFPKEVADVFNLKSNAAKLKIHPNVMKGVIEISVK